MAGSEAATAAPGNGGGEVSVSLKDQGNEFFKAGNHLKAAALYTQAIKQDPKNPTLYSNRAAAFLNLAKLTKALADAEMTISLSPNWEKGYFRKGCVLEAMERYDEALDAFQVASQYNPQSTEVSRKIKRISQLARDKKRAEEVEKMRANVDVAKHLSTLKSELSEKYRGEECCGDIFSFLVETMENAVKTWHETAKVDPRVYFLLDNEKTDTEKYAPVVNIDKAFESPHTHSNCFSFLRQYAVDSFSKAACLVTPKSIISYPQKEAFILLKTDCPVELCVTYCIVRAYRLPRLVLYCLHLSGKVKALGNGDMDNRMDSLSNSSRLICVNCGLSLVAMGKGRHYAGETLVLSSFAYLFNSSLSFELDYSLKACAACALFGWTRSIFTKALRGLYGDTYLTFICMNLIELCSALYRDPEALDIGAHEVLPRLFKETTSNS
ncbi:hypothetical protein Cgig2_008853 [Carnegiea gigantea]|uniref:Uncharacterized protein n=1 Tax=Carnegiea gigantea TaxID=171969 RepID=A0A9Q1GUJ6_9CARY|nr:hypothetical protein Cgig2_008853 [Carnegiea gigantea]